LKEFVCCFRHLIYGTIERELVGLRRPCEAAEFANKLQRRSADFFVRRRRFEIVQGLNVSTHTGYLSIDVEVSRQLTLDRATELNTQCVLHVF
jgi:hypothetical protein